MSDDNAAIVEFITRREAADIARVSAPTLDAWLKREDAPPHSRVGRRVLIERAPFVAWIRGYKKGDRAPKPADAATPESV